MSKRLAVLAVVALCVVPLASAQAQGRGRGAQQRATGGSKGATASTQSGATGSTGATVGSGAAVGATIGGGVGSVEMTNGTRVRSGSVAGPPSRPPGWDRGEKTGWRGQALPPGLAKKNGMAANAQKGAAKNNPKP